MLPVEQLHPQALMRLAQAAPPGSPALAVYNGGEVPNDAELPYVVLWAVTSRPEGTAHNMRSDRARTRGIFHCVAADVTGVQAVAGRLSAALLDVTPVIPGRTCWPISDADAGQAPQPDDTTLLRQVTLMVEYVLESVPAPSAP